MHKCYAAVFSLAVLFLACSTSSPGFRTMSESQSFTSAKKVEMAEAEAALRQAALSGVIGTSPYEFCLGEEYLFLAREMKTRGDTQAMYDYLALSKEMSETSLRKPGVVSIDPVSLPSDREACESEFARLKESYLSIDTNKAITVAPMLYARLKGALSLAEYEVQAMRYKQAGEVLGVAGAYLNALLAQDTDGDGVADLFDGAPLAPEDKDGFEDEDGIPDLDNDQDGVLDANDVAPNTPETKNRWHDEDGAPDEYPILEALSFETGSDSLSGESKGYLRGLAIVLEEWPLLKLRIVGYPDANGDPQGSFDLAQRRSTAVRDYLASVGVSSGQLEVAFSEGGADGANKSCVRLEFR